EPTPRAMSVNMLGLTLRIDIQARSKNGQPHQKTTPVDRTSFSQLSGPANRCRGFPGSISAIAIRKTGSPRTTPTQNRFVMSTSSGFGPSSTVTVRGSSAMPHLGHEPGRSLTTSGGIGQVYSTEFGVSGVAGPIEP